ncbi:MAG: hypothetical protein EOP00_14145 [Pedobacter sp.]|nr:MAG: hypothetical protein EOP00_14145 [Pedobacter sp.]
MITPENNIPLDDSQNSEAEDQQSQKDIHSNGFDATNVVTEDEQQSDTDLLKQAYDASESSYTLDTGDEDE